MVLLDVSIDTVRRDLEVLEKKGHQTGPWRYYIKTKERPCFKGSFSSVGVENFSLPLILLNCQSFHIDVGGGFGL